jgi:hypothetical protein
MEELQPNVPESKYKPLNLEEFQELKLNLQGVGTHLPTHLAGYMWAKCNAIRGERTSQPCTCQSSGGLWMACINDLNQFVKDKENAE